MQTYFALTSSNNINYDEMNNYLIDVALSNNEYKYLAIRRLAKSMFSFLI